jgi:hypothetical protein
MCKIPSAPASVGQTERTPRYRVAPIIRYAWHKNSLSGHEWATPVDTGKYHVIGAQALDHEYRSEKKAAEYAAFCEKFGPTPLPLTKQELKWQAACVRMNTSAAKLGELNEI